MDVWVNENYNGIAIFNENDECVYFNIWFDFDEMTKSKIIKEFKSYDGDAHEEEGILTFENLKELNDFNSWERLQ